MTRHERTTHSGSSTKKSIGTFNWPVGRGSGIAIGHNPCEPVVRNERSAPSAGRDRADKGVVEEKLLSVVGIRTLKEESRSSNYTFCRHSHIEDAVLQAVQRYLANEQVSTMTALVSQRRARLSVSLRICSERRRARGLRSNFSTPRQRLYVPYSHLTGCLLQLQLQV